MLGPSFYQKLGDISRELHMNPRDLLLVMSFESGVNPKSKNPKGAYGLIQFSPNTLRGFGLSDSDIAKFTSMPADKQLDYVKRYIDGKKDIMGGKHFLSATHYYHANFFPKTLYRWHGNNPFTNRDVIVVSSKSNDPQERAAYKENTILDTDHDGIITVGDLTRTLLKQSQTQNFQNAVAGLNATIGNGNVSEIRYLNKKNVPIEAITHKKDNAVRPAQYSQQSTSTTDITGIPVVDQAIDKLEQFVSKLINANEVHTLIVDGGDLPAKLEYARVLKTALREELGINSEICVNHDRVNVNAYPTTNDVKDSPEVIPEISRIVAEAFQFATKKIGSVVIDTHIVYGKKSPYDVLDDATAEKNYRKFNLRFIKGVR